MTNLTIRRALLGHFTDRTLRHGLFFFQLTDLNQNNIFVDEYWHIRHAVDLEWASCLPVQTLRAPFWMTGRPMVGITGEHSDTFNKAYHEFMDIYKEEEKTFPPCTVYDNDPVYRANIMRKDWEVGNFWFFQALESVKAIYKISRNHVQPVFASSHSHGKDSARIV